MNSTPSDLAYRTGNISSTQTIDKTFCTLVKAKAHASKLPNCIGFSVENVTKPTASDKEYMCHFKEGPATIFDIGKWHTFLTTVECEDDHDNDDDVDDADDMSAIELLMSTLRSHAQNQSSEVLEQVRKAFSSGRKFADYRVHQIDDFVFTEPATGVKQEMDDTGDSFSCNPFAVSSKLFQLDLLTDSGTNRLTDEQRELATQYRRLVPSIEMFSYARCTPREHLEQVFRASFGEQFNYYPALQGRAAEKMLLQASLEAGLHRRGDRILPNRPFDTTKGHIGACGLHVEALTPLTSPAAYYAAEDVFLGNIAESVFTQFLEHFAAEKLQVATLLVTVTDNGGGGQPVSMANLKLLAGKARERGLLVWLDACRIFENALFIKTFEAGYAAKSISAIAKEMLSLADLATMSLKKMYSHAGGAILVNRDSLPALALRKLDASIKRQTTTDYGNGYRSYSGLTGESMLEMMTGLMMACDEAVTGRRLAQVGRVSCFLKQRYDLPVLAGGHALYIASELVLPSVPLTHCPAENLNALMMKAIQLRGCGLGLLVYGGRIEHEDGRVELKKALSMDSLRLAIPRQQYSDNELMSALMVVGEAHASGILEKLCGGLYPKDYVDNGFYHFGGEYEVRNTAEFNATVTLLRVIQAAQKHEALALDARS